MTDDFVISELDRLRFDLRSVSAFELVTFMELARQIKQQDFTDSIDYVASKEKLIDRQPIDRFKYLCGILYKIKKAYKYTGYSESDNQLGDETT